MRSLVLDNTVRDTQLRGPTTYLPRRGYPEVLIENGIKCYNDSKTVLLTTRTKEDAHTKGSTHDQRTKIFSVIKSDLPILMTSDRMKKPHNDTHKFYKSQHIQSKVQFVNEIYLFFFLIIKEKKCNAVFNFKYIYSCKIFCFYMDL